MNGKSLFKFMHLFSKQMKCMVREEFSNIYDVIYERSLSYFARFINKMSEGCDTLPNDKLGRMHDLDTEMGK
jgi:hypothetical protein